MSSSPTSNILLAGSGLSGLTLALECARRPFFQDKKIVLIDRDDKSRNDRTWCFWAKEGEPLPPVGHKIWDQCLFFGAHFDKVLDIAPYQYHMIRGLDFYNWAKTELAKYPNVQRITANILDIDAQNGIVKTDQGNFHGEWVFNSARYPTASETLTGKSVDGAQWAAPNRKSKIQNPKSPHTFLLQHFKGWIIETPTPVFNPAAVTFMDYRLEQHGETRFVYVLPLTETRALVEFTVFSPALCRAEEYDAELHQYISNVLKIRAYSVEEEEFGVIPMTDLPLSPGGEGRVINIGTAGGFVKASSGYAFLRTQRKLRTFVDAWEKSGSPDPSVLQSSRGFQALDSIMLRVLRDGSVSGKDFFSLL
ncbi:MAG: lycopene cyclase family protein, partial [Saprospiraceae bacterium]|nr:lycopene cyclase family protein [Saprospiraceae bacterium]